MSARDRPILRPLLDESAKAAAREAAAAARTARSDLAAASAAASASASAAQASQPSGAVQVAASPPRGRPLSEPPQAVPAAATGAKVWAVSTRALRTRFESEQMLVALRDAALRGPRDDAAQALRFEVLPTGDDWRAVTWPFAERREAERLRAELLSRGLRVEVVAF